MVQESKKILIPVEMKRRELSAKLFLSVVLAGRGYEVYLGNKIQHTALSRIAPDVYFEIGAKGKSNRLQYLKHNGVKTVILDSEGSAFPGPDEFADMMDKETLSYTDCYFAWGEAAKEVVNEVSPETRVEVTGNPRFDLLQKPHRAFYEPTSNQLNKQYGDYILFNGNFPLPNGEKTTIEKSKHWEKDNPSWTHLMGVLREQSKIFGEFIRCISEVAEYFPDKNIIVRPHPNENPKFYKNIFYGHKNVYTESRFEVRPWILGASVVVHNSCTTGVTSALLDTPVIAYVPDGLEVTSTPNDVSNRCQNINEVCESIESYLNVEEQKFLDDVTKSKVRRHIDNIDYLSSKRIADILDSLMSNTTDRKSLKTNKKLRLRQFITRMVGTKRFEEIWVKRIRNEKRNKFPYCESSEIKSIIENFNDDIKSKNLVWDRVPYVVNGFRIKNKP